MAFGKQVYKLLWGLSCKKQQNTQVVFVTNPECLEIMIALQKNPVSPGFPKRVKPCLNYTRKFNSEKNLNFLKLSNKIYKTKVRMSYYAYMKSFYEQIRNLRSSNPKIYWDILKRLDGNSTLKIPNDNMDDFYNHFAILFPQQAPPGPDLDLILAEEPNMILNRAITHDEVRYEIRNLSNNKASGSDQLINEFFK